MKLKKPVKLTILIIFIIVTFWVFYSFINLEYKIQYKIKNYEITESYFKNEYYLIESIHNNVTFNLNLSTKYLNKKKIIDHVEIYEDDKYNCVLYRSKYIDTYPVCIDEEKNYISYTLINTKDFEKFYTKKEKSNLNETYKKINITTLTENILIWNYKGYIYLNKDGKFDYIKFLNNEYYYNNKAFQIENYILTPNYDEKYEFNSFYLINLENGKLSKWEIETTLSYNYYLLGVKDGKGYLIDKKSKKEYMLNPKKEHIEEISENNNGKIWNGKWENISMSKLIQKEYEFKKEGLDFYITNNKLYCNETLISNSKVNQIINSNKDKVYYLVGDKLYGYDPFYGEYLICSYSEWNFNFYNQIFIY